MANFICEACGYEHNGRCRPKECPKCGADKEKFKKQDKK